ncbi:MAG: hypothetical protein PHE15_02240 [Dehalococcoidales bacterium]|nr:hypothetical protein [Dehalococcoidales bacterium]
MESRKKHDRVNCYGYKKVIIALSAAIWTVNGKKVLRHFHALGLAQLFTNTTAWLKVQPNGKAIEVGTVMIDFIKRCVIKVREIMLR